LRIVHTSYRCAQGSPIDEIFKALLFALLLRQLHAQSSRFAEAVAGLCNRAHEHIIRHLILRGARIGRCALDAEQRVKTRPLEPCTNGARVGALFRAPCVGAGGTASKQPAQ
jgi:hypothetical protein